MESILRIEFYDDGDGPCLFLQAIKSERWDKIGFRTFLSDVTKGEVEIAQMALDKLLEQPERPGFQGMEFWEDRRLAWGSPKKELLMPLEDINLPPGAKDWIRERFKVVES